MVTTQNFQGKVENLGLQVTPQGDVFRTRGSSGMTLDGGTCWEGNIFGMLT